MGKKTLITRREFVFSSLISLFIIYISRLRETKARLSIHQGYTDSESTTITVLRLRKKDIQYNILENGLPRPELLKSVTTTTRFGSSLDRLDISGLKPGVQYQLDVFEKEELLDQRYFRSLDLDLSQPKIAVISCTADEWRVDKASMWSSLFSTQPDLIFCLGDNVYLDGSSWGWGVLWYLVPDPDRIWRRYVDMRNKLELYRHPHLIPMLAIWDDHDFGHDGCDSSYQFKKESKNIFETFFPRPAESKIFAPGPGLAMSWMAFNTQFIFLDSRYFRRSGADPLTRTQWGSEQKLWLSQLLGQSQNPVWILNGSQFVGGDPDNQQNDSVAKQHPEDLSWLQQELKKLRSSVALISGDMHYSEVVKLSPEWGRSDLYEVTSSALHAIPSAPVGQGTQDRLALTLENNFLILEPLLKEPNKKWLRITSYGARTKPLFDLKI